MQILVVDDAPVLRASFARIVTLLGHAPPAQAANAADALSLARSLAPGAIIIDGRHGGVDVLALIAALRLAAPRACVFVVAALEETALVRAALAAGAVGALRRPFSALQVSEALQSVLVARERDESGCG